jgi:hypothetical protein
MPKCKWFQSGLRLLARRMEAAMLSEIFMLRLEEEIRVSAHSLSNDRRFVAYSIDLAVIELTRRLEGIVSKQDRSAL